MVSLTIALAVFLIFVQVKIAHAWTWGAGGHIEKSGVVLSNQSAFGFSAGLYWNLASKTLDGDRGLSAEMIILQGSGDRRRMIDFWMNDNPTVNPWTLTAGEGIFGSFGWRFADEYDDPVAVNPVQIATNFFTAAQFPNTADDTQMIVALSRINGSLFLSVNTNSEPYSLCATLDSYFLPELPGSAGNYYTFIFRAERLNGWENGKTNLLIDWLRIQCI